jgi:2,3-bisphosphoglycerate-independent phosphoglycerate mutase
LAARRGLKQIYLHAFLDGRDVPPKSAAESLALMEAKFKALGVGRIATIIGRFYAMDRDNRWERVSQAYAAIVKGESQQTAATPQAGLDAAYAHGETDEFVLPTLIPDSEGNVAKLEPGDSVVFMNFRADRAREISQAITASDFTGFERNHAAHQGYFATLTEYHQAFDYPVAFPSTDIKNSLGEYLSGLGMTQLRLAETEKYAHVTFFFNGGVDACFHGEDRILVPSPKVRTYDLQPEMSLPEVTDKFVEAILGGKYDVIVCNFANGDMVGHTGVIPAAVKAVEAIDHALGRVVDALKQVGGEMLITADHGNIEKMVDEETGQPHTAHTTNPVPLLYVGQQGKLVAGGSLSDLAPTMLDLLGLSQPAEMTGRSLIAAN